MIKLSSHILDYMLFSSRETTHFTVFISEVPQESLAASWFSGSHVVLVLTCVVSLALLVLVWES